MATFKEILNFESAFAAGAAAALFAAQDIRAIPQLERGVLAPQYIGVMLTQGQTTGHQHPLGDGNYVHDDFMGTLRFVVRTERESEDAFGAIPLHNELKAAVRAFMAEHWQTINDHLSLHWITDYPIPGANAPEQQSDRYDYSELPYEISFSVRTNVWPA